MDDRQLIEDLLSALEYHTEQTRPIEFSKVAIEATREYLRKPPQRTWAGLTNGEMIELSEMKLGGWDLILEVEDKLRSKNT